MPLGFWAMFSSYHGMSIETLHNLPGRYIDKPKKGAH
jgi:hypothetical protein